MNYIKVSLLSAIALIGSLQAIRVHVDNMSGKPLMVNLYNEHNQEYSYDDGHSRLKDNSRWDAEISGSLNNIWWSKDDGKSWSGWYSDALSIQQDAYWHIDGNNLLVSGSAKDAQRAGMAALGVMSVGVLPLIGVGR